MTVTEMGSGRRRIVLSDLFVAFTTVAGGGMLATIWFAPTQWWVAVAAFAVTVVLFTTADRSKASVYRLLGGMTLTTVVFVAAIAWLTDNTVLALIPLLQIGMGIGVGVNRFVFGVVHPVPEARRRREETTRSRLS